MRIAAEIGWGHKPGGARRAAINTLLAMARLEPGNGYTVYSNCAHPEFAGSIVKEITLAPPGYIPPVIWDQFVFPHAAVPIAARGVKPDVMLYTNNIMSVIPPAPSVVTIYDMLPFILPGSFVPAHGLYQRTYFRYAVNKAKKIITTSESSKKDICGILSVPSDKVTVVPLASFLEAKTGSSPAVLREKFGIDKPFIFYAGAIHPRKNVSKLVEAFAELKKGAGAGYKLVIAGTFRWMKAKAIDAKALEKVKDDVIFTGAVSDDDLAGLYGACAVFVYPSLYEGFGLPVLEAMSAGAPVVTSNLSSLPEVAGDAAILVDPSDVCSISEGIARVISDPGLGADLSRRSKERASLFSWEKTALLTLKVLHSIGGGDGK